MVESVNLCQLIVFAHANGKNESAVTWKYLYRGTTIIFHAVKQCMKQKRGSAVVAPPIFDIRKQPEQSLLDPCLSIHCGGHRL